MSADYMRTGWDAEQKTLVSDDPRFFMQKRISRAQVNALVTQAFLLGRTTFGAPPQTVFENLLNVLPFPEKITQEYIDGVRLWLYPAESVEHEQKS